MNGFLSLRNSIKRIFNKSDIVIIPACKFVLAFLVFLFINTKYGHMELINNIFIEIVLALLCALLPTAGITILAVIMIILHAFAVDLVAGVFAILLFVLLMILILRFVSKDAIIMILVPVAAAIGITPIIPLFLGVFRKTSTVFAGIGGVILYCYLESVEVLNDTIEGMSKIDIVSSLVENLLNHSELILLSVVFAAVILVVHVIRHTLTSYPYIISSAIGAVLYIVLRILGSVFLETDVNIVADVIGSIIAFVLISCGAFVYYCIDYKKSKKLQFEDDEYYYFVKAVPKFEKEPEYYQEDEYEYEEKKERKKERKQKDKAHKENADDRVLGERKADSAARKKDDRTDGLKAVSKVEDLGQTRMINLGNDTIKIDNMNQDLGSTKQINFDFLDED